MGQRISTDFQSIEARFEFGNLSVNHVIAGAITGLITVREFQYSKDSTPREHLQIQAVEATIEDCGGMYKTDSTAGNSGKQLILTIGGQGSRRAHAITQSHQTNVAATGKERLLTTG